MRRNHISLTENSLVVRIPHWSKTREHIVKLPDIQQVIYGEPLNVLEQGLTTLHRLGVKRANIDAFREIKRGQLNIRCLDGRRICVYSFDSVFDEDQRGAFLAELDRRGIDVQVTSYG